MRLLIVDTFYLLHRSFHIGQKTGARSLTRNRGSGHIFYAVRSLQSIIEKEKIDKLFFAWDAGPGPGGKNARHLGKSLEYKGNRQKNPDEQSLFQRCVHEFMEIVQCLPCSVGAMLGFEADDVINTVVKKNTGHKIFILTKDFDIGALLRPGVVLTDGKHKITDVDIKSKYHIEKPAQLSLLKALRGDKSDNISGIKGVGPTFLSNYTATNPKELFKQLKPKDKWLLKEKATVLLNWHLTQMYDVKFFEQTFEFNERRFKSLMDSWDIRTVNPQVFAGLVKKKGLW